jgi:hypothetical protein
MEKPPKQYVDLTADQVAELRQFYNYCDEEHARGKPGVLLAQVGKMKQSVMVVNFIPYEIACELKAVMKRMGYYDEPQQASE